MSLWSSIIKAKFTLDLYDIVLQALTDKINNFPSSLCTVTTSKIYFLSTKIGNEIWVGEIILLTVSTWRRKAHITLLTPCIFWVQLVVHLISPAFILGCPCSCRERYSCRSRKSLGGEDVLFIPRWAISLFSDGVSSWWLVTTCNQSFLIIRDLMSALEFS